MRFIRFCWGLALITGLAGCASQDEPVAIQSVALPVAKAPQRRPVEGSSRPAWLRSPLYDPSADAHSLVANAIAQASATHRRILIQWGNNRCVWCYRLHDLFETDSETQRLFESNYVFVPVDSGNSELASSLGTRLGSLPSLTVLEEHGQVLVHQETDSLRVGDQFDPPKVQAFLKNWASQSPTGESEETSPSIP
jgi:hypothetical protein